MLIKACMEGAGGRAHTLPPLYSLSRGTYAWREAITAPPVARQKPPGVATQAGTHRRHVPARARWRMQRPRPACAAPARTGRAGGVPAEIGPH
jgi:hypothetical protein